MENIPDRLANCDGLGRRGEGEPRCTANSELSPSLSVMEDVTRKHIHGVRNGTSRVLGLDVKDPRFLLTGIISSSTLFFHGCLSAVYQKGTIYTTSCQITDLLIPSPTGLEVFP